MKTTSIHYSKVFSLGNFQNEKIGVDVEVQEGDNIQSAIQQARDFVEFNHKLNGINAELHQCEYVLNNPDDFTGTRVKQAKQRKEEIEAQIATGNRLLATGNTEL